MVLTPWIFTIHFAIESLLLAAECCVEIVKVNCGGADSRGLKRCPPRKRNSTVCHHEDARAMVGTSPFTDASVASPTTRPRHGQPPNFVARR